MIEFVKRPYFGSAAAQWDVSSDLPRSCHLVTLSETKPNMLELTPYRIFKQRFYNDRRVLIYGIASDHDEGVAVMVRMIQDCYEQTGKTDVVPFLKERCGA